MSRCLDTSPTTHMAQTTGAWEKIERSCGTSWAKFVRPSISLDCKGKDNSSKLCWNLDGRKFRTGDVCSFIVNKAYFCQHMWMTLKMAAKKQNLAPMWKKCMKNVGIDEPTSFLDHVYLGCTQRESKPNEAITKKYTKKFESRISVGPTQKLPGWQKPQAHSVVWSYDMEGHAQKCVERYCELANKIVEQLYKVSRLSLDDDQFKKEELGSVGELWEVCSNACTWHELDDLTSCAPWTKWQDQSQNGLKHEIND